MKVDGPEESDPRMIKTQVEDTGRSHGRHRSEAKSCSRDGLEPPEDGVLGPKEPVPRVE